VRNLRGELDWIVMKAIAKEPARRYQTPSALAEDVDRHLAHEPVLASPPSVGYRLTKFIRRHRTSVAAAAVSTVALLTATVTSTWSWAREREIADRYRILRIGTRADQLDAELSRIQILDAESEDTTRWLREVRALDEQAAALLTRGVRYRERSDPESKTLAMAVDQTSSRLEKLRQLMQRAEIRRTAHGRVDSDHESRTAWEACIADIAERDGWQLAPQRGLLPLGRNAQHGLHEFLHIESLAPGTAAPEDPRNAGSGIVLVLVMPPPGGRFEAGDPLPDRPADLDADASGWDEFTKRWSEPWTARIERPFLIAKCEVTQAQWHRLAFERPSYYCTGSHSFMGPSDLHPVENVDVDAARNVLRCYGLDYPDEARWEYAARAGVSRATRGESYNALDRSWQSVFPDSAYDPGVRDDGYPAHAPVSAFQPNAFGLHHAIGNVAEVCVAHDDPTRLWGRGGSFRERDELCVFAKRTWVPSDKRSSSELGLRPIAIWDPEPERIGR
jgi:formylglycine-generating enzyme required for sulfatase activity